MKYIIYFIFILLNIYISDVFSQLNGFPTVLNYEIKENSITYRYNENDTYYSAWNFDSNDYRLDFKCEVNNVKIRECNALINNENLMKIYGTVYGCISNLPPQGTPENCRYALPENNYPTPIVKPYFSPSTRGGSTTLSGFYLFIGSISKLYKLITAIPKPIHLQVLEKSNLLNLDPTNVKVDFPSGCGYQTIQWLNENTYNFTYQKPSISKVTINDTKIIIDGNNFSNVSSNVSLEMKNIEISNKDIISIDHERIIINHNQQYSTKATIIINTCQLKSNEYSIQFEPIPLKVNSVPSSIGGLITITGERLSGIPSSNSVIVVKIGNSLCSNIKSSLNQIICEVPLMVQEGKDNLPVLISIDGIENKEKSLLFSYDIPWISNDYSLPNGLLLLRGTCFGNESSIIIYLNNIETKVTNLTITQDQTILSFQLPNDKRLTNISISNNGGITKSNSIQVDATFYAVVNNNGNDISPSVSGQTIEYTLFNIKSNNLNLIPNIKFKSNINNNNLINGTLITGTIYSFKIPSGCGENDILISIGDQSSPSIIKYKTPIINNCLIDSNNKNIKCIGNFSDYLNYYNSNQIKFKLSNIVIQNNNNQSSTTFTNDSFSFPLLSDYESSNLIIQICNLDSNPYKLDINPTFKNYTLSSNYYYTSQSASQDGTNARGNTVILYGENFNSISTNNTFIKCGDDLFKCTLNNFTSIYCNLNNLIGPFDKICKIIFNGINQDDKEIRISFSPPIITNLKNHINLSKGGILTIIGNEFYNTNDIEIKIGNLNCDSPKFIDSNTLTCLLIPQESNSTIENEQLVNITINGKSGINKLLIYSTGNDGNGIDGSGNNNNENNNSNSKDLSLKAKVLIGIFIPLSLIVFFIILVFTTKKKLNEKNKKKIQEKYDDKNEIKNSRIIPKIERIQNVDDNDDHPIEVDGASNNNNTV